MKDNIFNLNKFFDEGGQIKFVANEDFLKSAAKHNNTDVSSLLYKFMPLDKDGNVYMDKMYCTEWHYNDKKLALEDLTEELIKYKVKFKNNTKVNAFPDIVFSKLDTRMYISKKYESIESRQTEIRLMSSSISGLDDASRFTIGHELGHSYLEQCNVNKPEIKRSKWSFIVLCILCLYHIIFINAIIETFSTESILIVKWFIITFLPIKLLFIDYIVLKSMTSWKQRAN